MAILLPVLSRAKGMALATVCMSQQRQLGLVIEEYKDDYDLIEPFRFRNGTGDWPGESEGRLSQRLNKMHDGAPYLDNPELLFCPAFPASWQDYWQPNGAAGGGITSTYLYMYRHVPREEDRLVDNTGHHGDGQTDLRLGHPQIINEKAETREAICVDSPYTVFPASVWPDGINYSYEHYNALYTDGRVELVGKDLYAWRSFLGLDP